MNHMRVTLYRDYKEEGWESMEVYADNLLRALHATGVGATFHSFTAFPGLSRKIAPKNKLIRYMFRFLINPVFGSKSQGDVNHIIDQANAHLLALLDPRKTIVTCHDLIVPYWVMHNVPQTYKKRIKRIGELWRIRFLKKAAKIIAVSQATKDDIVNTLGIAPQQIIVIPEGVDADFKKQISTRSQKEIAAFYTLPRRFILHVGTTHEYKNMEALLTLFAELRKNDKSLFLVKVGSPWSADQQAYIRRYSLEKFIFHLGFIDKKDLPTIYSLALALVHPSRTEGFGFTVLEAMAAGCPVIVSDIPALREMADDAAIYIQPDITKQDIRNVAAFLRSPARRADRGRRGRKRAARYSWRTCAQRTYHLYQEIYNRQKEHR
jgi:glycosyltransferase involved in cell wall biosynthesis